MSKRGNGEGSVYFQESRQRWAGAVTLEGGKRKVLYGSTRQEVAKKLASALRDVDHGLPLPGGQLTVAKYLADWLEQSARPKLKPGTFRSYEELVRVHIAPELGHHRLVKLTPQHVQTFLNRKQTSGSSPRRTQMLRDVLRAALNRAVKWDLVGRNVVHQTEPPRVPVTEIHALAPEQASALLAAARGHRYEHLYTLLLTTGLRMGEALALRWKSDVDLEIGRTVTVHHTLAWLSRQPWSLAEPKAASA